MCQILLVPAIGANESALGHIIIQKLLKEIVFRSSKRKYIFIFQRVKIPNLLTFLFPKSFTYRALSSHGGVDPKNRGLRK